jgi:GT2 family glycosyltransferase
MKLTCWTNLFSTTPVLLLSAAVPRIWRELDPAKTTVLAADPANFAQCVNRAAQAVEDGLLVTLPPDLISLEENWQQLLLKAAAEHPAEVFFYGNYFVSEKDSQKLQTVRGDIGDITEREDWGPVWAVRAEWLRRNPLDEVHHRAAFYDLLLKSWGQRVHVGGILGTVAAPEADASENALKQKLFFPGRGKLGGFSYLFMDKEEERRIENVFYAFLQRQHAWLEGERTATPPPFTGGPEGALVSVVTPVYNRARFIGKAIESVQRQTLTDWEYVIVDNGSTDGTRDVVRSYMAADPRIRLVENDQNVIALSLNLGVKNARGKYIAQLDSDDEYLPHTLAKMTEALETHPTWGLAISYYELMDEAGNSLPEFGIIRHEQYNRNNILRRDGAGALRCWHRSVILEFGGFDEKELGHYGEDYDLVLKCGEKYEVGRVHEVCYRYRRHDDNTDVKRDGEMKIRNKTIARLNAIKRRQNLNAF